MKFHILGPLEVVDGSGPVDLGAGKHRAVLALLLLHANEAVPVDRMIDDLWGERPPATATKIVQNSVSRLRKALGEEAVLTRGRGYEIPLAHGALDARQFEQLFAQARQALASGDHETTDARLREALALWRGPVLAEFGFEPFAQAGIARLEERRLAALEEKLDNDLALGRSTEVVLEAEGIVAANPLRERPRASLILALYRSGRQAEALQVYQDARRTLVDELGVEPGPALQQLQRAILRQDPSLGPALAPRRVARVPAPARRRNPWVLIGGATAAVLVAGVAALALLGDDDAARTIEASGNSLAAIDPASNRVVADIPVGRTPADVAFGEGAVWTLNADDQTITRFSPDTKATHTFAIGSSPTALAAGGGALWAATAGRGRALTGYDAPQKQVDRIDSGSTSVSAQIALPPESSATVDVPPTGVVVGDGAVWALGPGGGVVRIDPQTALVATKVRGLKAKAIAYGRGALWAISQSNAVVRIDPRLARVTKRIELHATALDAIAAGAGATWVADGADGTLWRVDTGGPRVVSRTIAMDQGVNGIAVEPDAVWAINGLRGTLTRVDPRTNRVRATIAVGNTPAAVDVGGGRVWVAVRGGSGTALPATRDTSGLTLLPSSACGRLTAGVKPDVLIASEFPLQGRGWHRALAGAVGFVLRQHDFRAGRFHVGYQSCDDSTPTSGGADPGKCTANAKLLAANPDVVGVVGPLESSCAGIEIPVLNRASDGPLALISPANSGISLTRADRFASPPGAPRSLYPTGVRNYARVYPRDDVQAAAGVVLARDLRLRRVFVLDDGEPYGQGMASHFRASARGLGVGLVGAARWDFMGHGLGALARRVGRAHPDGVYLGGVLAASGGDLVRALRAHLGRRVTLIAPDAFAPVWALWDQAGTAARGLYITIGGVPNGRLGKAGRRFVEEFSGTQPRGVVGPFAVSAAAATETLLDAIARSDGTRASVTRELLRSKLADGVLGALSFDRNGDMTDPAVMALRVEGREDASDVEGYEGAKVVRVIHPR